MTQINDVQKMAIRAAIDKMMRDGYLSISTLDKCLKLANRIPPKEEYDVLSTLHCVNFNDMHPDLLKQIPTMIIKLFDFGLDRDWLNHLLEGRGQTKKLQ